MAPNTSYLNEISKLILARIFTPLQLSIKNIFNDFSDGRQKIWPVVWLEMFCPWERELCSI